MYATVVLLMASTPVRSQEFKIQTTNCNDMYQPSNGSSTVAMGKTVAQVDDWRPYVTMEAGSRLMNDILKQTILACRAYLPRVFQIVAHAANGTGGVPMLTAHYFIDGKRWGPLDNRIPQFQQAAANSERKPPAPTVPVAPPATQTPAPQTTSRPSAQSPSQVAALDTAEIQQMERQAEDAATTRAKSAPADSWCVLSCDPREEHGRQAFKNRISAMLGTPVIVTNFIKTNGARIKAGGREIYEMQFTAELALPRGFVSKPTDYYDEIDKASNGYSKFTELNQFVSLKPKTKMGKWWEPASFSASGNVNFGKTEKGWLGVDGRAY
jgi:hypothetical protein